CIWSPPPTYPPGGEIWSPVLKPGGQFSVRTPQSSVIGLLGIAKLEIQTLSLPSTTTAQGPGEAAARARRAGRLRAVRPQQGDDAVPALLLGHGPCHVLRGRLQPLELQACRHVDQVRHAPEAMAEPVGNPYVALTVDIHTAVADSGLKVFGLAR